jgi:hypothetical protein
MVTPLAGGSTFIGRLSVRAPGLDPLSARLRIERALAHTDLRPRGLPPSAVLCIRSLKDPLPGRLSLHGPAPQAPAAWERAVVEALTRAAREAARPALGAVPASAQAVLFADRAELLACLASDHCEGAAFGRWWWREILRGRETAAAVVSAWTESPEYVPAALAHLADRGVAAAFVRRLGTAAASTLLSAVLQRFELPELSPIMDSIARPISPSSRETPIEPSPVAAPWQRWAPPAAEAALAPIERALLGIGLTLARAPTTARRPAFAAEARAWAAAARSPAAPAPIETVTAPEIPQSIERPAAPAPPAPSTRSTKPPPASPPDAVDARPSAPAVPSISTPPAPAPIVPEAPAPAPSHPSSREEPPPALAAPEPGIAEPPAPVEAPTSIEAPTPIAAPIPIEPATPIEAPDRIEEPLPVRPAASIISTDLGGVFYLVNLALYLGLYGDFSTPASPGIGLDLWDFLTLVGQSLLGDEFEGDPLWPLLAELAGRDPGDPPGADFDSPFDWLPPRSAADPAMALSPLAPFTLTPGAPPLKSWLDWLMPYLRTRLRLALGAATDAEAARMLLLHPARVLVTGTHVDIMLGLADLPLPIRFAGLDRNPGFIPAAGRYVTFYFE